MTSSIRFGLVGAAWCYLWASRDPRSKLRLICVKKITFLALQFLSGRLTNWAKTGSLPNYTTVAHAFVKAAFRLGLRVPLPPATTFNSLKLPKTLPIVCISLYINRRHKFLSLCEVFHLPILLNTACPNRQSYSTYYMLFAGWDWGPYSEKLWPRFWKCCHRPLAEGSIFKPEVTVFPYTDRP